MASWRAAEGGCLKRLSMEAMWGNAHGSEGQEIKLTPETLKIKKIL